MQLRVDVRAVTHRSGVGKSSKEPYAMDIASVIVTNPDGSEALGELVLPKGHPAIERGLHDALLVAVSYQGKVEFRLKNLAPVREVAKPRAAA